MQVCSGAWAMLMFDGFACLEEASGMFPAQDWGVFRAAAGEKDQHCSCISTALCAPWALPQPLQQPGCTQCSSWVLPPVVILWCLHSWQNELFYRNGARFSRSTNVIQLSEMSWFMCLTLKHFDNHCSSSNLLASYLELLSESQNYLGWKKPPEIIKSSLD